MVVLNGHNFTVEFIEEKIKIAENYRKGCDNFELGPMCHHIDYLRCIRDKLNTDLWSGIFINRNETNDCKSTKIYEGKTWKELINIIFQPDTLYEGEGNGGKKNKRKRTIKKSIKKNKKSRRNMKQI
jgi:hypothetical protein